MGKTNIEWTSTVLPDGTVIPGYSSNPLRYRNAAGKDVWACVMTSPGCANCYAQASAVRFDKGHEFTRENMKSLVPYVREKDGVKILAGFRDKKGADPEDWPSDLKIRQFPEV